MTFRDTLGLALGNLSQARLRTLLTTLGVAIGIAALVGMVAFGAGLQDQLMGRFMASGVFDAITVTSPAANGALPAILGGRGNANGRGRAAGRGGRSGGQAGAPADAPPLDDAAIASIKALPNVVDVFPAVRVPVQLTLGEFTEGGLALGVPMSARGDGAFKTMTAGTFFTADTADECVISHDLAKRIDPEAPLGLVGRALSLGYAAAPELTPPVLPMGASPGALAALFQVKRVTWTCRIAGIAEREPGAGLGGFGFAGVMLPLPRALAIDAEVVRSPQALLEGRRPGRSRTYASLTVKVAKAQHTGDVEAAIKARGFTAFSLNDALEGAKRAFILLDILLSLVGSIALAVSSLGIVNTMVMSILERTREIGVMKAVGADDADIRRIFLVEASAIGVAGGLGGIALGWGVARVINVAANIYIARQGGEPGNLFAFPWWLIAGSLAFAWLVSLVAGSIPANRAARLNPLTALRHD